MEQNKNGLPETFNTGNVDFEKNSIDDFKLKIEDEVYNTTSDLDIKNQSLKGNSNATQGSASERDLGASVYYSEKKSKDQKKAHKKRDKMKSIKNRRVFRLVWICMVVLVSLTAASFLITGSNDLFAIGREDGVNVILEIPEETTFEELAELFHENDIVAEPYFFALYGDLTTDAKYTKGGSYEIATNLDYEELINIVQAGPNNTEVVRITFNEGYNVEDIANLLEEEGIISAQEVLDAAKSTQFDDYDMISYIENESDRYYTLEGYLFPDTYDFLKGEDVESVIGKFLNNFQTKITKEIYDEIQASGMTIDEVIILASLIQREAADAEDMYNVSSVLHNRLERGAEVGIYALELDSTIFYPYNTREDLPADMSDYVSSYNTYDIQGLPAGAIANPGLEAIYAALRPNDTNYFYFCHSEDKTAYYAETFAGHEANLIEAGLTD